MTISILDAGQRVMRASFTQPRLKAALAVLGKREDLDACRRAADLKIHLTQLPDLHDAAGDGLREVEEALRNTAVRNNR